MAKLMKVCNPFLVPLALHFLPSYSEGDIPCVDTPLIWNG